MVAEGAFLPREAEFAEEFGVSRQAVREALKVLAAKGLVMSRRRAGTYVTPRASWNLLDPDVLAWHPSDRLTPEFNNDLIELRRLIEPAAAALAATRGDRQRIATIGAALEKMQATAGKTDEFFAADAEFHVAIFAASGNTLIDRLSTILGPLLQASFPVVHAAVSSFGPTLAMHEEIYAAIVAGLAPKARSGMEALLSMVSAEMSRRAAE